MRTTKKYTLIIITNVLFAFVNISISFSQDYDKFLQKIENYQHTIKLNKKGTEIDSLTFNFEKYLNFYNKIKVKKGIKLDYKYFDNFLDGNPYFYAWKDTFDINNYIKQETLKNIKVDTMFMFEYKPKVTHSKPFQFLNDSNEKNKQIGFEIKYNQENYEIVFHHKLFNFLNDSINRAYNYMIPDDNNEGYFQYLHFKEYGEMFCLKWHAAYKFKSIIDTKAEIKEIIKDYANENYCEKSEISKLKKLKFINPKPIIVMDAKYCKITLYEKEFFGIYKRTYRINRSLSHKIELESENELVEISPNFVF